MGNVWEKRSILLWWWLLLTTGGREIPPPESASDTWMLFPTSRLANKNLGLSKIGKTGLTDWKSRRMVKKSQIKKATRYCLNVGPKENILRNVCLMSWQVLTLKHATILTSKEWSSTILFVVYKRVICNHGRLTPWCSNPTTRNREF